MVKKTYIIPTARTLSYVHASELFKGLDKLWNEWVELGPHFSWGDNDFTLVACETLLEEMSQHSIENQKQLDELEKRITKLAPGICINLEH